MPLLNVRICFICTEANSAVHQLHTRLCECVVAAEGLRELFVDYQLCNFSEARDLNDEELLQRATPNHVARDASRCVYLYQIWLLDPALSVFCDDICLLFCQRESP